MTRSKGTVSLKIKTEAYVRAKKAAKDSDKTMIDWLSELIMKGTIPPFNKPLHNHIRNQNE